ncbi:hypothetical protein HK405_016081 [Cladochytrium tenue]|nr:hypothetical protein HK405_016081 [Cladochytrium tenue]
MSRNRLGDIGGGGGGGNGGADGTLTRLLRPDEEAAGAADAAAAGNSGGGSIFPAFLFPFARRAPPPRLAPEVSADRLLALPATELPIFAKQCEIVREIIARISRNAERIARLNRAVLVGGGTGVGPPGVLGSAGRKDTYVEIDDLCSDSTKLIRRARTALRHLAQFRNPSVEHEADAEGYYDDHPIPTDDDLRTRNGLYATALRSLNAAVRAHWGVQADVRQSRTELFKRSYRLVKPDATDEEATRAALDAEYGDDDDDGDGTAEPTAPFARSVVVVANQQPSGATDADGIYGGGDPDGAPAQHPTADDQNGLPGGAGQDQNGGIDVDVDGGGGGELAEGLRELVTWDDTTAALHQQVEAEQAGLRQLRSRQRQIRRATAQMEELLALAEELQALVEEHQEYVDATERHAVQTRWDVEEANVQLKVATDHAESTRAKRWVLFTIILVLLAIVGIVAGVELKKVASGVY